MTKNVTITSTYPSQIDGQYVSSGVNSVSAGVHTFSVPLKQKSNGHLYKCIGYSDGSGDFSASGDDISVTVDIEQASAITWVFQEICVVCEDQLDANGICLSCGYNQSMNTV